MMKPIRKMTMLLTAAGAAVGLASAAGAQTVINISGATLFENFFASQASTNDYFDVDGNGVARIVGTNQQLAPFALPPNPASQHWAVTYRSTGSGNGVAEFVAWGQVWAVGGDGVELSSDDAENAYFNRTKWKDKVTGLQPIANIGNPGACPVRSDMGSLIATYMGPPLPSAGGIRMDLAITDVPTRWFVTRPGSPAFYLLPGQDGYGTNPRRSTNTMGTSDGANQANTLKNLGNLNLFNPADPGSADANTVFDTPIAGVPIAPLTNFGTGLQTITFTDLRYLCTTGRRSNGENIVFVTRDSGSGTRNGFQNSIGVDPSWGIGENIGPKSEDPAKDLVGPNFVPSNKAGSGSVEATVKNHRLAIGYTGAERAITKNLITSGQMEILDTKDDIAGGTEFVRPTADAVLDNGLIGETDPSTGLAYTHDGWRIGGPETFASIGDPRAAPFAKGGDENGNPQMANVEAAAYLNNISLSIAAFVDDPGADETIFTPGEYLAVNFLLNAASDRVQDLADPTNLIVNPALNVDLQEFTRINSIVFGHPAMQAFNTTATGLVPTRTEGVIYSDGVAGGAHYVAQNGTILTYGAAVNARNKLCGDFNNDGVRDLGDAAGMVAAWIDRDGGTPWQPGSDACIEIIGDFNADGNFNTADVRYFADGLAIDPMTGGVDRRKGFEAVDAAFGGNFFDTALATPRAWVEGGSAADVSGPDAVYTREFQPIGFDGMVDGYDIDYIYANFGDWSDMNQAVAIDLSCDVTGDLVVDQADVDRVVLDVLGTTYGDVNLDGDCDETDLSIVDANLGQPGGWADGDVSGDGVVDMADRAIVADCVNPCLGDFNGDGVRDTADFFEFFAGFFATPPSADYNRDGATNTSDFFEFFADFFGPPC